MAMGTLAATRTTTGRPHVFVRRGVQTLDHAVAEAAVPVQHGSTENFSISYDADLGEDGARLADAILEKCEPDFATLQRYFGGITPPNLPFKILVTTESGGAYHFGCAGTELYVGGRSASGASADFMLSLVVAEEDEVFEAASGLGWDCSASNGEGLSRVLANDLYPGVEPPNFLSAPVWLDEPGRPDWASRTEPTDRNYVSIGCAVLFLNWLRFQLNFSWPQIIAAGAPTLGAVYQHLTGKTDGFERFKDQLEANYPSGTPSGLTTDQPYPLPEWNTMTVKTKNPEKPMSQAQALDQLKEQQQRLLPGTLVSPFLTEPAEFVSGRSPAELAASQEKQLIAVPRLKRTPAVMDLAEVIGAAQVRDIQQSGQLVFHATGDTGNGKHDNLGQVAAVMAMDYHRPNPADHPAFFLHLGDVIYNLIYGEIESKSKMYLPQFYRPYDDYPGKILAIAGNHDSDPEEDPKSIEAFQENFCAPPPQSDEELARLLQSPNRPPMYQPGVYYRLDAPFVQILALFSNGGEQEGVLRGGIVGNDQWNFLLEQLKEIKASRKHGQRRALLLAVHHPPFSGGGGHAGSGQMLQDLDTAFETAGILPDAVLSGHAHNYQRFTREVTHGGATVQIPFLVSGCGGHHIEPMKPRPDRKPVRTPLAGKALASGRAGASLRQYFNGFGHLYITVTKQILTIDLMGTKTHANAAVDSVTVDLSLNRITEETPPFSHPANGEQQTAHLSD
jgi:hypothetical protein